ncbi:hypothetical protein F4859DRAFT_192534 [Xylaria cf. heliscus]|nr:hypothetical protein F4859DRAFT_192534 [Xylaria cf. heliscus]
MTCLPRGCVQYIYIPPREVISVRCTFIYNCLRTRADRTLSIRSRLPEGYRVEPMIWRGVIDEGGPEVSFNGTIEEVTQQIQAVKRDFTWESLRRDLVDTTTPLEKRSKTKTICGVGGEDVGHGPLTPNVEDLRDKIAKMAGTCAVAGGPRVCTVLTCTNNAAVWLCNDNTWAISPTCSYLATYVTDIVGTCCQDYYHGHRFCRGQEFDSDNYNVIVGWKRSC